MERKEHIHGHEELLCVQERVSLDFGLGCDYTQMARYSLDCAIVDLFDKVFSPGMAYVAILRVRTLAGLHLVAFDPNSIMVSTSW